MRTNRAFFLTAALAVAQFHGTSKSHASMIIAEDDFSNAVASLAAWTAESNATHEVLDDSAGLGSGNALFVTHTANANRTTFAFPEVTLTQPGDWIQVDLEYRLNGTFTPQRLVPVIGLFQDINSAGQINIDSNVGYVAKLTTSPRPAGPPPMPDTAGLGRDTSEISGTLAGTDTHNLFTAENLAHIAEGQNYTLQLRITRNALGQAVLDFELGGAGTYTMTAIDEEPDPVMSFSAFGIRTNANDFVIDNVVVSAIPEPSLFLLVLGGALGLLGLRRRMRHSA